MNAVDEVLKEKLKYVPLRYHKKKDGTVFPAEISASVFVVYGRKMFCGNGL